MKTDFAAIQEKRAKAHLLTDFRKVEVEGIADTVAVGYVKELTNLRPGQRAKAAYIVFFGKQAKPIRHEGAASIEAAEAEVTRLLNNAAENARQVAARRKEPRQDYHETEHNGITTRSYTTAGTAQLIRVALKKAFPDVKFSVTSDVYSQGSSVRIAYKDGPAEAQVREVYAPYKSGSFDSSQDMYVYKDKLTTVEEGGKLVRISYGAKYISCQREYSPAYGFFLNAVDLRQAPTLEVQFRAFFEWHRRQLSYAQCSYGVKNGTYTLTSDSSHGNLERFGESLTVQGHTVMVSTTAEGTCLAVTSVGEPTEPEPTEPAPAAPAPVAEDQEPQAATPKLTPLQNEVLLLLAHPAFTEQEQERGRANVQACTNADRLRHWSTNLLLHSAKWEEERLALEGQQQALAVHA